MVAIVVLVCKREVAPLTDMKYRSNPALCAVKMIS